MSSTQLVDERDVARDTALLRATKQRVRDEVAKRTAARVGKYLACPSNTVVDLHPDSDPWELHSRAGTITFVRGATEILTATEISPGTNQWVLTYVSPVGELNFDPPSPPRDDRAIPESTQDPGPD